VVWEPFGGLCSAAVAAIATGRTPYAAEPDDDFHALAARRLRDALKGESG
jgi:site-specific DNA-methyltransferase (adenine-specific)